MLNNMNEIDQQYEAQKERLNFDLERMKQDIDDLKWNMEKRGRVYTSTGDPTGVIKPNKPGEFYIDTSAPQLYVSTGVTSADWSAV